MAANKFATMLHRNTNKITLILIYAVLEWTLIVLLLLNSLFSYLIIKFAEYVGLKPPCLWCSRLDHIFEPRKKNKNMHRDLLCEGHAKEISKLGYCSNHQKLAESLDMCGDCSSSRPELAKNFNFFPWMKDLKMIQSDEDKVVENGTDVSFKCSCCGVCLDSDVYSPYIVIKPSWNVLDYPQKGNLITVAGDADDVEKAEYSDQSRSDVLIDQSENDIRLGKVSETQILSDVSEGFSVKEKDAEVDKDVTLELEKEQVEETLDMVIMKDQSVQVSIEEVAPVDILSQHLEFFIDCSGQQLVPIELIDSTTEEDQSRYMVTEEYHDRHDYQESNLGSEIQVETEVELDVATKCKEMEAAGETEPSAFVNREEPNFIVFDSIELEEEENSLVFHTKGSHPHMEDFDSVAFTQVAQNPSLDGIDVQANAEAEWEVKQYEVSNIQAPEKTEGEEKHSTVPLDSEEGSQMVNNETEADVSIGTEIPDLDIMGDFLTHESPSYVRSNEDPSSSSANSFGAYNQGSLQLQDQIVELKPLSFQTTDDMNRQPPVSANVNEIEEEKVPDTPTSTDSFHHIHKKLLLLEKKDSGTEDSLEGSIVSELEGADGVTAIEHLKSALRAERKALHALYAELEEERNASAVAASQTMAMINRLQEEKAAMQMEALQYQRMMEEQSEYDQEALQLLNELMVKREKEKQELEKELEVYRKKVFDYEAKEKMRLMRRSKDGSARSGFSSASCSNAEDSDGLSIDLNQEAKEDDSCDNHHELSHHDTPIDAILNLQESLADFEEERISILEQLKVLEERLMTLDDGEVQHFEDVRSAEQHFQDVKSDEQYQQENGTHTEDNDHFIGEVNGHANGYEKEMNGIHHPAKRIMGAKAKRLLPLFDATSDENGDVILNGDANGLHSNGVHDSPVSNFGSENKKVAIEEEVDHLYERLQALEADREFLKHCITSLNKGDKGTELLQEILQHLRDLRNVELRVRNLSDGPTF